MQESLTIPKEALRISMSMRPATDQTTSVLKKTRTFRIKTTQDEDGRVVITSPELPGLVTDGADKQEAIMNAFDAIEAMLESMGENVKEQSITLID